MTQRGCPHIEADIVAVATDEAPATTRLRVDDHIRECAPCRAELARYRTVDELVDAVRRAEPPPEVVTTARVHLQSALADLRRRLLRYRIFPSADGPILIAQSEEGVALVEYLDRAHIHASRLSRIADVEAVEDGGHVARLYDELREYLGGTRTQLDWPLDLRFARGPFDRLVLQAAAKIPRGAVESYAGLAAEIGKPTAVRAVAQALRWNPTVIALPCHRVIGTDGTLTGYAGNKLSVKGRLLTLEGVRITRAARHPRVARDRMYTLTRGDREYCLPTCPSVVSVSLARLMLFGSREQAEAVGLEPCSTCRPDLHPISV